MGLYASGHSLHVRTHKLSRVAGNAPRRLNRCLLKQSTATRFRMTVQKYCFLLGLIGKDFPNLSESCPNCPKVTYRFRFMFLCSEFSSTNHPNSLVRRAPPCICPREAAKIVKKESRCKLLIFRRIAFLVQKVAFFVKK